MKSRLLQTLLVASFGAMAITATAQNATPRDNPAGTNANQTAPQNGTQPAAPSAAPAGTGYGTSGTMAPGTATTTTTTSTSTTTKYKRLSDADMRAYREGRLACDRLAPGASQDSCRSQFTTTWASVDPKCQKVAIGAALDECLKGSDHAN